MGLKLDWVPKQISNIYKAPPPSPVSSFSPPVPWLPLIEQIDLEWEGALARAGGSGPLHRLIVPHLTVLAFFGAALAFELSQVQPQRIAASQ